MGPAQGCSGQEEERDCQWSLREARELCASQPFPHLRVPVFLILQASPAAPERWETAWPLRVAIATRVTLPRLDEGCWRGQLGGGSTLLLSTPQALTLSVPREAEWVIPLTVLPPGGAEAWGGEAHSCPQAVGAWQLGQSLQGVSADDSQATQAVWSRPILPSGLCTQVWPRGWPGGETVRGPACL